jgi:hypothetical protein
MLDMLPPQMLQRRPFVPETCVPHEVAAAMSLSWLEVQKIFYSTHRLGSPHWFEYSSHQSIARGILARILRFHKYRTDMYNAGQDILKTSAVALHGSWLE